MPTKPNRAGQQQNYVPQGNGDASGEYADNSSGSNKHFTNFKKPDGEQPGIKVKQPQQQPKQEPQDIGVQIKDKGDKPADTSTIKSKYDGNGGKVLADSLQARFKKSPNSKALLESVSGADDEISGVIGDFYAANPKVQIRLGKNLNSKYVTSFSGGWFSGKTETKWEVQLGQGVFKEEEYYSKGGVFFHESGHALDATFVNENGARDEWSYSYISKKHGKSMKDMVKEEIRQYKDKYQEIKDSIAKEQKDLELKFFGEKEQQELLSLNEKLKDISNRLDNDEGFTQIKNKQDKLTTKLYDVRREYFKDIHNEEKKNAYLSASKEFNDTFDEIRNYQKDFYAKNYPEREKMVERQNELMDLKCDAKSKAKAQICVKYGDLSDMFMGSYVGDLCGMGHTQYGYWTDRHRGNECFAEITSAKATNQASLELMKKYIPKTLEIYDEIMDQIKNNKNVYNKA